MSELHPPPGCAPAPSAAASEPRLDRLVAAFAERRATIAVVGLGYVGLPLALTAAEAGFRTLGFDADRAKAQAIAAGESPIRGIPVVRLRQALLGDRFAVAEGWEGLAAADAVLVCVPTPLGPGQRPDLSAVEDAARRIAAWLRPGQLVVLESTTWPGTTREVVRPILEAGGLRCGREVFLAHAPEREDPGSASFTAATTPRVVGGADPASLRLALALYGSIAGGTVPVGSLEAAEAAKLTENVFRAVNIALANELKLVFDAMGIDVWEVMAAAATKPFGFMPFWPGPGLGGHCIPVDPHYLAWQARRHGVPARLVELAAEVNDAMPAHVLGRLAEALGRRGRALRGSRVLVLGIGYKRNIDDVRESPGLRLMALAEAAGAEARYHDPLVPVLPAWAEPSGLAGRRSAPLSAEVLAGCDAVLVAADHDAVDYALVVGAAPLVVDTRDACARRGLGGSHVVKA